MKQLEPTSIDEYIAEHKAGDKVSGRLVDLRQSKARVELGEGVLATCRLATETRAADASPASKADLASLTAMLSNRWKGGADASGPGKAEPARVGQVRSFRITQLDPAAKTIELELAD
jgi:small subunit ribosomal protein S1